MDVNRNQVCLKTNAPNDGRKEEKPALEAYRERS
jgi:hypothetical protein